MSYDMYKFKAVLGESHCFESKLREQFFGSA